MLRAAVRALVAAFEDDPLLAQIFPKERDRAALLRSGVRASVRLAKRRGRIDVYRQPDGELAGAAMWLPGDAVGSLPGLTERLRLGAEVLLRRPAAVPHLVRHQVRLRAIHRRLGPHQYLALLGVRPEYRRRGIGTELLEVGLEQCQPVDLRAVLDTSLRRNAEWYARHGFIVVDVVHWRFGTTWVMQRGAASGPLSGQ